jgi:hypothetical protein
LGKNVNLLMGTAAIKGRISSEEIMSKRMDLMKRWVRIWSLEKE